MEKWTEKDLSVSLRRFIRSSECKQPERVFWFSNGGGARYPNNTVTVLKLLNEKFGRGRYRYVIYRGAWCDWVIIKCPDHGDQKCKLAILFATRHKYACYWCGIEDLNPLKKDIQYCPLCCKLGYGLLGDKRHQKAEWHQKMLTSFISGFIRNCDSPIYLEVAQVICYFWGMKIFNFK